MWIIVKSNGEKTTHIGDYWSMKTLKDRLTDQQPDSRTFFILKPYCEKCKSIIGNDQFDKCMNCGQ